MSAALRYTHKSLAAHLFSRIWREVASLKPLDIFTTECTAFQAAQVIEVDSLGRNNRAILHDLPTLRMCHHSSVQGG
jgi:hypothetical protein